MDHNDKILKQLHTHACVYVHNRNSTCAQADGRTLLCGMVPLLVLLLLLAHDNKAAPVQRGVADLVAC
jgi:hypothetical protein